MLSTAGVGDPYQLITPEFGVLVREHSDEARSAAVRAIGALLPDRERSGARCRAVAARELPLSEVGVPRYLAVYEHAANGRADSPSKQG